MNIKATKTDLIIIAILIIMITVVLNVAGRSDGYRAGYKQGQIDALTKNKIIYCLKTDVLNQSTWQLCEE